jgi:S1-C subfamily serine protease
VPDRDPPFASVRLGAHPRPEDVVCDLDDVLDSVVSLRSHVPDDAYTAGILGTEREGQGVVIGDDGIVVTIGYLVTEAEQIWLVGPNGAAVAAHVAAYDQETGFGLVQALGRLDAPKIRLGSSAGVKVGDPLIIAGEGGRESAINVQVISKREFAGSWEYVIDDAIFTAPSHPKWSGAAAIDRMGNLVGIGSLYIQQAVPGDEQVDGNMIVPIDLLKPIVNDLLTYGRPNKPARPWLGMTTAEADEKLVVAGLSKGGPAQRAGVEPGDIVVGVDGEPVVGLAHLFRSIWALGDAGVTVPLVLNRDGRAVTVNVASAARDNFLKKPRRH